MTKKNLALEIHEYLLSVGEADETEFESALLLKDLYDCGKCLIHVAQVYVKGIIPASGKRVFGMDEEVLPEEVKKIWERARDRKLRFFVEKMTPNSEIGYISDISEVKDLQADDNIVIADLRTVSLGELNRNPFLLTHDIYSVIVTTCERGYQSRFAAQIFKKAGFKKVYVLKAHPGGVKG